MNEKRSIGECCASNLPTMIVVFVVVFELAAPEVSFSVKASGRTSDALVLRRASLALTCLSLRSTCSGPSMKSEVGGLMECLVHRLPRCLRFRMSSPQNVTRRPINSSILKSSRPCLMLRALCRASSAALKRTRESSVASCGRVTVFHRTFAETSD